MCGSRLHRLYVSESNKIKINTILKSVDIKPSKRQVKELTLSISKTALLASFFLTLLTFLDHLHVQGRPLFQSSSVVDRVLCLQSVGIYSCLPVCCPSVSFFRSLRLPETSNLSDFAQMRLCFLLKRWPNHFSLLFSREVLTGFTCAPFPMSSFLMWSNLVLPLAHLNILISAEFSLFSSFFFTAQHSEPYVIAGLMIVLKTLSFNSTGIFLSHSTPDTSFHFIHPILIILLTSACEPPSLVNSDPMYLKDVTVGSSASTIITVVSVSLILWGSASIMSLFC